MSTKTKIVLSAIFILVVAFFAARSCSQKTLKVPKPPALPAPRAAKMAIILDDWGNHLARFKDAAEIGRPLTLAVLPHLPHSRRIALDAKKAGLGLMLHMPMQPQSKSQPLEPHTIMTTMLDAEILRYLNAALESVPGVEGVNNHQGSAATSDKRVMRTVLMDLKKKGLFFVDSEVIAESVGAETAEELGVPFARRDVFLDNTATVDAVKSELRRAEEIALKRGQVICIGHDKKATLEAIRQMVPEIEGKGIKLVLVKDLLDRGEL